MGPGKENMRHDILASQYFAFLDCDACIAYSARVTALMVFESVVFFFNAVYVSYQCYDLANLLLLMVAAFNRIPSSILPVAVSFLRIRAIDLGLFPILHLKSYPLYPRIPYLTCPTLRHSNFITSICTIRTHDQLTEFEHKDVSTKRLPGPFQREHPCPVSPRISLRCSRPNIPGPLHHPLEPPRHSRR